MKKLLITLIAFLGVGTAYTIAQNLQRHAPVPEINLPQPNGELLTLSSLKGKYVLISFWGSATPCQRESKPFRKAYKELKDKDFTILSVSIDKLTDKQHWQDTIQSDGMIWHNVLDSEGTTADAYGVTSLPTSFLIDPDGNLLAQGDALRHPQLMKTLTKYIK